MDFEILVSEINLHPALWDKKNKYYSNRIITDKIWGEVAEKTKCSKEECKKKWKYLKDEFRKAVRKEPKTASGSAATQFKSSFKYFELMYFLKDHVVWKSSEGNLNENEEILNAKDVEIIDENEKDSRKEQPNEIQQNKDKIVKQKIIKRRKENMDDYLEIEKKKTKLLEVDILNTKNENCEDLHFFKSLIPHMKTLAPVQKLQARAEIQSVVLKYIQGVSSSNPITTPIPSSHSQSPSWYSNEDYQLGTISKNISFNDY